MARDPKEKPQIPNRDAKAQSDKEAVIARRKNRGNGEIADWENVNSDRLFRALCCVTARGFGIQFGYTRDGGAYSIRIVGASEPITDYVRPTEDMDTYLNSLIEDFGIE